MPVSVGVTALLFGLGHGLVLSLAAFVWFGIVIALRPHPHRQHLPGVRRPLHVQRDRDDRALALLIVTVLSMLCAARSSCSPVSPSRLPRPLRHPSSPPPPRPSTGVAPLRVTLAANGDAAPYAWDLGDGTTACRRDRHPRLPGRPLHGDRDGDERGGRGHAGAGTGRRLSSRTLSLAAPRTADFGGAATLTGVLRPAARGARVQIYRANTYVTSASVGRERPLSSPHPPPLARARTTSASAALARRPGRSRSVRSSRPSLPRGRPGRRHADAQPEARSGTRRRRFACASSATAGSSAAGRAGSRRRDRARSGSS